MPRVRERKRSDVPASTVDSRTRVHVRHAISRESTWQLATSVRELVSVTASVSCSQELSQMWWRLPPALSLPRKTAGPGVGADTNPLTSEDPVRPRGRCARAELASSVSSALLRRPRRLLSIRRDR